MFNLRRDVFLSINVCSTKKIQQFEIILEYLRDFVITRTCLLNITFFTLHVLCRLRNFYSWNITPKYVLSILWRHCLVLRCSTQIRDGFTWSNFSFSCISPWLKLHFHVNIVIIPWLKKILWVIGALRSQQQDSNHHMIFFNQGIIAPRFKPFSYLIVIYISHVVMLAPLETFLRCIYVTSQRRSIYLNYSFSQLFCSPNQKYCWWQWSRKENWEPSSVSFNRNTDENIIENMVNFT